MNVQRVGLQDKLYCLIFWCKRSSAKGLRSNFYRYSDIMVNGQNKLKSGGWKYAQLIWIFGILAYEAFLGYFGALEDDITTSVGNKMNSSKRTFFPKTMPTYTSSMVKRQTNLAQEVLSKEIVHNIDEISLVSI